MAEKLSDFNMPQAVVDKILKQALPDVTLTPDALSALCKAASIFTLYTTSHANRVAGLEKRRQLVAQDIVEATHFMDLDHFSPSLKLVYQQNKRDRDAHNEKRRQQRQNKRQNSLLLASAAQPVSQSHDDHDDEHDDDDNEAVLTISDSD